MLLDALMPRFHAVERHEIVVNASPDALWSALESADLGRPLLIRLLMGLRTIPAWFTRDANIRKQISNARRERLTLRMLESRGFQPMAEEPRREIVFGIEGHFWELVPDVRPGDRERFARPLPAGTARAAWNFLVEPVEGPRSRLLTITRIECADRATLLRFRVYWTFVRPFSGLIRIAMLQAVRNHLRATARG